MATPRQHADRIAKAFDSKDINDSTMAMICNMLATDASGAIIDAVLLFCHHFPQEVEKHYADLGYRPESC